MPLVSVLLTVRNGEATIVRSVESIINQSFTDFEFLIVDDYSTDNTPSILKDIVDHRIRPLQAPEPGLVNALNYGLKHAQGKYIARMDADDYSYPNRLKLQVEVLENDSSVEVVSGVVNHITTNSNQEGYAQHVEQINSWITPHDHYANRFRDAPVANPSVMFRAELLQHGYYKEFDGPEDYHFWLRLLHSGTQFKKIEQPVLDWYDYSTRLTRTSPNYSSQAFFKLKAEYFARQWKEESQNKKLWVWGYGKDVFTKSKWLEYYNLEITGYIDIKERPKARRKVAHYTNINLKEVFTLIYVSDRKGQKNIEKWMTKEGLEPVKNYYFMA